MTAVAVTLAARRVLFLYRLATVGPAAPERDRVRQEERRRGDQGAAGRGLRPAEAAKWTAVRRRALLRDVGVPDPGDRLPRGVRRPARRDPGLDFAHPAHRALGRCSASCRTSSRCCACSAWSRSRSSGSSNAPKKLGRKSRFYGSHLGGAWLVLFMIFNVIWTMFLFRGAVGGATATCPYDSGAFASLGVGERPAGTATRAGDRERRPAAAHRRHAGVPGHRGELQAPAHLHRAAERAVRAAARRRWAPAAADASRRQAARPRGRATSTSDSSAAARSRTSPGRASSTSPPAPSAAAASRSARPGTPRSRCRRRC